MGSIYGVSTRRSTCVAVASVTIQGGGWGCQNEPPPPAQNEPQTLSKRINTPLPPTARVRGVHPTPTPADAGGGRLRTRRQPTSRHLLLLAPLVDSWSGFRCVPTGQPGPGSSHDAPRAPTNRPTGTRTGTTEKTWSTTTPRSSGR
nr:MAG TPA: hypothetical protein [Caudoviricetes sp.]